MRLLLLVPAAALLALGGEGLYHAIRGRDRVAIDCAEFARARPSSHRVAITGCNIDFAHAGYSGANGHVDELYLPARPAGKTVPTTLVVATRDPSALALAQSVFAGDVEPGRANAAMEKAVESLGANVAIDGLIRSGTIEGFRTRRIVSGLNSAPLAADVAMIDVGGSPDFVRPLLAIGAAALLAIAAIGWRRSSAAREPEPRQVTEHPWESEPAVVEEHPASAFVQTAPPSTVALPRLLLLKLDVMAGPEAIEIAPPLGSRRDVIAIVTGIVPDASMDDRNRVLARPDGSLRLDLGPQDPVAAIVTDARGEAGAALVKEILLMTGWRAFAPKTGLFVTADEVSALGALAANEAAGPLG